jgi:hypothetical protein
MTPHPEAVEERRAEIARLAEAWVKAAVDNEWHGSRQTKASLAAAKSAFAAALSAMRSDHA